MTDSSDQIRPLAAVLRDIRGGAALDRAAEQLHELTEAVAATGRAGTLTIKVTVKPYGKTQADMLDVTVTTMCKAPEVGINEYSSMFYADGGNLVREDPRQQVLPIRAVPDLPERTAQ